MTDLNMSVTGLFETEEKAAESIIELKKSGWKNLKVFSPIPSGEISRAMETPKSRVGWFTLVGGVTGFFSGFLFAIFTATRWNLIVSGKPVISLIPFFIVGFEFTILFAVVGNVIGLLTQTGLPNYKDMDGYDPLCSGSRFGVSASCDSGDKDQLMQFFKDRGAVLRSEHF